MHLFHQKINHISIFLLIAGNIYTSLRGRWGWSLFGLIWGIAICGILLELMLTKRNKKLALTLYLCMGWLVIIAIHPLQERLDPAGFRLLLYVFYSMGGLTSLGVIFYVWKSCPLNHAVWHLFVLVGSIFYFYAIFSTFYPETVYRDGFCFTTPYQPD